MLELVLEIDHEGIVLVPQVGDKDLVGAERRYAHDLEREENQNKRNEKRQKKVDPYAVAVKKRALCEGGLTAGGSDGGLLFSFSCHSLLLYFFIFICILPLFSGQVNTNFVILKKFFQNHLHETPDLI